MTGTTTTLVVLAHAGGSIGTLLPLAEPLGNRLRFHGAELPGHGRRIYEPLLPSIEAMADTVLDEIRPLVARPYALFGHSMGALVAHRLALAAHAENLPLPRRLFVSGCAAPGIGCLSPRVAELDGEDFWRHVAQYDGLPKDFLASAELKAVFEPILRADFRAVADYRPPLAPALPVPVTVMAGQQDAVSQNELEAWQATTTEPLEVCTFPGGHFYLLDHITPLADLVRTRCACPAV
jgi:surfactin synthase thioesterase subunit